MDNAYDMIKGIAILRCSEKQNAIDLAHDVCVDLMLMDNERLNILVNNSHLGSFIYKRVGWYLKNTRWSYHKQYMNNTEPLTNDLEYNESEQPISDHEIARLMNDTEIRLLAAYCTEGSAMAIHRKYGVHHVTVGQYLKRIREKIIKYNDNRDSTDTGK